MDEEVVSRKGEKGRYALSGPAWNCRPDIRSESDQSDVR